MYGTCTCTSIVLLHFCSGRPCVHWSKHSTTLKLPAVKYQNSERWTYNCDLALWPSLSQIFLFLFFIFMLLLLFCCCCCCWWSFDLRTNKKKKIVLLHFLLLCLSKIDIWAITNTQAQHKKVRNHFFVQEITSPTSNRYIYFVSFIIENQPSVECVELQLPTVLQWPH